MSHLIKLLEEHNPEAVIWDGCDDALIGVTSDGCAVYSIERLWDVFIKQGMTSEEAVEWVDFNLISTYLGDYTPVHIYEFKPSD